MKKPCLDEAQELLFVYYDYNIHVHQLLFVFSGLFGILAVAVYLVLYFQEFKNNVLVEYDLGNQLTSVDRAYLDWSFYLVVASLLAFLVNPILLKCSGSSVSCSFQQEAEKVTEEYPIY